MKKITLILLAAFLFVGIAGAQTYFSDDFSDGDISDWTLTDSDNDTRNWYVANIEPVQAQHITSASWVNVNGTGVILFPDNWAVSPAISLAGASGNVFLEWKVYGQDQSWANENYTVYVGTSSNIAALQTSTTTFNEIVGTSTGYMSRSLDVSSFAGQTIYVAFRHHNVSDQFRINIDDVIVRTPVDRDVIVESMSLDRYSLTSTDNALDLEVRNNGSLAVSSLEVNWNDGVDHIATVNVSIAPGATATITHPIMVNYSTIVERDINVTVSAVNGAADQSPLDNTDSAKFNTISQAGNKSVVIEEATGTWCGWCPRGKVGLDYMATTYPNTVVAIEVHNGDPMAIAAHDSGVTALTGGGWPNAAVDRSVNGVDPGQSSLQNAYNQVINNVVPVDLTASSVMNGSTLSITAGATFYTNFANSNYKLAAIITESNVTGTTAGYAQENYYSGGGSGPMGGFENLPNPVPASLMTYNHVSRALLGGFNGLAGSVPTTVTDGSNANTTFTYTIPATSDINEMHIVVLLIDGTDNSIVNGKEFSVNQTLSSQNVELAASLSLYPNPVNDILTISFDAGPLDPQGVTIVDMMGRIVYSSKSINFSSAGIFTVPVADLAQGKYILSVVTDVSTVTNTFIKK